MKRALLIVALGCAACGHSAPTRFYTLAPAKTASATAYNGPPVRLEAVHMPPSYAGRAILHASGTNEVTISTLERWTDDLDFLMRQTLAQNLASRLPQGTLIYPDAPRPAGTYLWVVDMLALREVDGKVTCDVSWSLLASDMPQAVQRRQGTYSASVDGSGNGTSTALSHINAELADAMVQSLEAMGSALAATRSPSANGSRAP